MRRYQVTVEVDDQDGRGRCRETVYVSAATPALAMIAGGGKFIRRRPEPVGVVDVTDHEPTANIFDAADPSDAIEDEAIAVESGWHPQVVAWAFGGPHR